MSQENLLLKEAIRVGQTAWGLLTQLEAPFLLPQPLSHPRNSPAHACAARGFPVQALGNKLHLPILGCRFQFKNVKVPLFFIFHDQGNPWWDIMKGDGGGHIV